MILFYNLIFLSFYNKKSLKKLILNKIYNIILINLINFIKIFNNQIKIYKLILFNKNKYNNLKNF